MTFTRSQHISYNHSELEKLENSNFCQTEATRLLKIKSKWRIVYKAANVNSREKFEIKEVIDNEHELFLLGDIGEKSQLVYHVRLRDIDIGIDITLIKQADVWADASFNVVHDMADNYLLKKYKVLATEKFHTSAVQKFWLTFSNRSLRKGYRVYYVFKNGKSNSQNALKINSTDKLCSLINAMWGNEEKFADRVLVVSQTPIDEFE